MKFAKVVFLAAGAFGVLALAPLYFMFDLFAIATDPVRFRPMMIPAVLEKVSYVGALLILYLRCWRCCSWLRS